MRGSDGPMKRSTTPVIGAPRIARTRLHDGHAVGACRCESILVRVTAVALPSVGNFRNAQLAQDRGDAAGVIAVGI